MSNVDRISLVSDNVSVHVYSPCAVAQKYHLYIVQQGSASGIIERQFSDYSLQHLITKKIFRGNLSLLDSFPEILRSTSCLSENGNWQCVSNNRSSCYFRITHEQEFDSDRKLPLWLAETSSDDTSELCTKYALTFYDLWELIEEILGKALFHKYKVQLIKNFEQVIAEELKNEYPLINMHLAQNVRAVLKSL